MKTIEINGYIGEYPNTVEGIRETLWNASISEGLKIKINSKGGSYPEALMIYDLLNTYRGKKHIRISPIAASAGAVIALLPGAEVSMPQNGLIRHHMPMVMGGDPKNSEELAGQIEQLKVVEETLVVSIVARCGGDKDKARAFLNEDKWMTAEQAKEFGLVDKVLPLNREKVSVTNLVLPEQIVAHVNTLNERVNNMLLKDLCSKIEIQVVDEATDDVMGEQIVNHVGTLLSTIQDLTTERDALKKEKEPPSFPERIVNILVRERESEIDRLVNEGLITGAVATGLKKQFAGKDEIVNRVDEEGNPSDGFDGLISSLSQNEKVINFGDQKKKAKLDKPEGDDEVNPLIANAEARAKKAKDSR